MKPQQESRSKTSRPRDPHDERRSDTSESDKKVAPERARYVAGADGTQEVHVPEDSGK